MAFPRYRPGSQGFRPGLRTAAAPRLKTLIRYGRRTLVLSPGWRVRSEPRADALVDLHLFNDSVTSTGFSDASTVTCFSSFAP